ncbi:MAG: GWxTD domain-containing protein [Candidatus Eisenbacteria bacterium]|nr:GWxTD domain-containing protein [Candidatus Eisenbacteria bacterium]
MRRSLTLLWLLALPIAIPPSAARAQMPAMDRRPAFTTSCASFRDTSGAPLVEVALEIGASELSFIREGGGFRAEVDIAVSLYDSRDELRGGDVWRRAVSLDHYGQLNRREPVIRERRRFPVPPGRYRVRVEVRDLNADASNATELETTVEGPGPRSGGRGPSLRLGDIQLGALADSLGPPRRDSIRPSVSLVFGNPLPRLACFGEAYVQGPGPDTVELRLRIFDESGAELADAPGVARVKDGVAAYLLRPPVDRLGVGGYLLEVQARWGGEKERRQLRFEMDETRIVFDEHFSEVIEMLALVARSDELDSLRDCPAPERQARWNRFWDRHNPDPGGKGNPAEREFFRRVRYATQHFSGKGLGPGWRTDMGRIYIKYGPPDQMEQRPRTATESAVEIWYYNEPTRMTFFFVDRTGFGRFELVDQRGG